MKKHIEHLYELSGKKSRRIIGLMSGTSLDGLDIAVCQIEGSGTETVLDLEYFTTVPYTDDFRNEILQIFAKRQIDFQQLCLLNPYIGSTHGKMILESLQAWDISPEYIDLIASHGQTVFHAPKKQHKIPGFPNATLQIGDGDHIAMTTGITTLSDFRQKHIAAGGEGAPLAVYGDHFLFSKKGENRVLLNMGGIANFTFLPGNLDTNAIFTTDTGPGNTLLDAYTKRFFHKPYDDKGAIAASGTVNETLLQALKSFPFFKAPFPKTTGPEVFNFDYVESAIQQCRLVSLSRNDIIATLTQLSAETIADAIKSIMVPDASYSIYTSGGGAHNPTLVKGISEALSRPVMKIDELGISGDAKEAVLFAVLANEAVAGQEMHFGEKEGVPGVSMGKISFPG
ncbi:anhydro-N-acetylmuramic acid kinase [Dyadobacter sp. CY326]|uniref:anhydro-N-acetylmuramic acid kinase n=1 Tax=Dyadobacter sp. CY326 TaxID=2907300 RepID=UPI001F2349E4|nr:anhydro-N-acetylmuramic acid kinase [Dyadobacter sp. CY326]MCE7067654.1 anhydro-N-acetylmuramic acid kinase [Dyadobacter sp. CY326]